MHVNEAMLRHIDEQMLHGDMDGYWAAHTDDVVANVAGRSRLAGVFEGKDQLQAVYSRFSERAGDWTYEPHEYLANDDHGVVLQRSHFLRDGERLDTEDVFVCHFRDGKISECWIMSVNQAEFDEFIG